MHPNELPLLHIFMNIDGTIKGANKSSGIIGSQLNGNVSKWDVVQFKLIHIDIKINKNLTDDPKNLFNVIQRSNEFPDFPMWKIFILEC